MVTRATLNERRYRRVSAGFAQARRFCRFALANSSASQSYHFPLIFVKADRTYITKKVNTIKTLIIEGKIKPPTS